MKKLVSLVMMLVMMLAITPLESQAQASKNSIKAAKTRAKELKKAGWEIVSGTTIEQALIDFNNKTAQDYEAVIGEGNDADKPSTAKLKARQDAATQIAETGKSVIKGRITSKIDDIDGEEVDNIVSGFERIMLKELEDVFPNPSFMLRKMKKNGRYDYQAFYAIPNKLIQQAQRKAIEAAIEEAGLAQKYGNSISDFINEGFKN